VASATSASMLARTLAIACAHADARCWRCRVAHPTHRSMAGRKLRGTVLIASNTSPSAALSGQRMLPVTGTPRAGQVSTCSRRCSVNRPSTLVQSTTRVAAVAARM